MSTAEAVPYLRWKKDVDQHDYAAASSYLSIRFGESRAEKVAAELRRLPVITRRANDILRATGRVPLPLSDPGVLKDLKKVLSGEELSPVLVAEADVADGYHRLSLAYALDPYTEVPLKLGGPGAAALLSGHATRVRRAPQGQPPAWMRSRRTRFPGRRAARPARSPCSARDNHTPRPPMLAIMLGHVPDQGQ
jgi:hypothetical protein